MAESYEGLVATRGFAPSTLNTTNRQLMSRSGHYARDDITSLKIAIPNWRIDSSSPFAEVGSGSDATVEASVEYPLGTMTRITFGGSNTGTIPNVETLISDYVDVDIPNGELFCIRIYWTSTTGVFSLNQDVSGSGTIGVGGLEVGVSGITNKVMSGTVTAADNGFPPLAIIGNTTKPSIIIVGDSITLGAPTTDGTGNTSGDFGSIARSIGPHFAYTLMAQNGDRALSYLLSNTNRSAMMQYGSHLICGYGSNDLFGASRSGAQCLADCQSIWAQMTSQDDIGTISRKAFQTTITPRSTSTDSWATSGANQTTVSGNTRRIDFNTLIRALPSGLNGFFEVADAMESASNSGLWAAPGGVALTGDGIHPNTAGNLLIQSSGAIDTDSLAFPALQAILNAIKDKNGAIVANQSFTWQWFDEVVAPYGAPVLTGTFTTDAEGIPPAITLEGTSLSTGEYGTLQASTLEENLSNLSTAIHFSYPVAVE